MFVNGAYNFTADTRGNLKVAYTEALQNDQFFSLPTTQLATGGVGNDLGGKVQTTEIFGSLTSKITKDLKVLASWRYEEKRDKTPLRTYGIPNNTGAYSSFQYNNPESYFANWGKLEANYNLGMGYGLSAGVDYTDKTNTDALNQNNYVMARKEVNELTYRLALRKSMSETLNGTVSVAHSERDGSEWHAAHHDAVGEIWAIYPIYQADRKRDKVRTMIDWMAAEGLDLQFAYEAYFDKYSRSVSGLEKGEGQVFSLDANYIVNDNWKVNAWYSKQTGDAQQTSRGAVCSDRNSASGAAVPDGNSNCSVTTYRTAATNTTSWNLIDWGANLKTNSDQFGLALNGKVKLVELGAQYLYAKDRGEQKISGVPATTVINNGGEQTAGVAANMGVMPDTSYTQSTFKLYGAYPLAKATKLRLDYIYDLRKMDDYTWQSFVYGDGTRVFVDPKQTTQIIGLSLIQSF